ncbi:hypothetical protein Sjap_022685 [Stephania japonica]|uniref:Bifunctional inhibitor/plant lipid transfer protein/seed storage helical domain-containing protein n=1 Tax=Stephania japonica TaxID=461633 RepID=A0AAP0EV12_9MAGN
MMVVSKLFVVLCVLAVSLFGGLERVSSQQHAPPPVDCSWRIELTTEIYDVPECMSFVNNGTQVHPEGHECCTWFQNIFFDKTNVNCLCEAFKSCTSQLGDVFNVTRAAALPAACGINDPSLVDCGRKCMHGSRGNNQAP